MSERSTPVVRRAFVHALYAPVLAFAMGLMFVRVPVTAALLEPTQFAEYGAALVVSGLSGMLAALGFFLRHQRDLPVLFVAGRMRAAAVSFLAAVGGTAAVALIGLVIAIAGGSLAGIGGGLLVAAVLHGVSQQLFLVATLDSRSRGRPMLFALENLGRALVLLAAIVLSAAFYRSAMAVVVAEAVAGGAVALFLLARALWALRVPIGTAVRLTVRSLPRQDVMSLGSLMLISVVSFLATNLDRWLAAESLSPTAFADYTFAWTVIIAALSVQALVNTSVFQIIARRYALGGRPASFRVSAAASGVMLAVGGAAAIPGYLLLEILIRAYFPAYVGSLPLLPWLIAAAVLRVSDFWASFLMIAGLEKRLLPAIAAATGLGLLLWYLYVSARGMAPGGEAFAALACLLAAATYACLFALAWRERSVASAGGPHRRESERMT